MRLYGIADPIRHADLTFYRPNIGHNLVFVIVPFGASFDGYDEQILRPVANELGRRALRSDPLY